MAGLYIHIPFCASRCIYCGFYSTTLSSLTTEYIDAVCKEMQLRKQYISEPVGSVYLGGGTPSQLSIEQLKKVFDNADRIWGLSHAKEITLECNPDDITKTYASSLSTLPINRISLGVQTFSDKRLGLLCRRHNTQQVYDAVSLLREAGFNNISIDLMFGFPDETIEEWEEDIRQALLLNVEHISAYSLMYEEGTPLFKMLQQGKVTELDDKISQDMYELLTKRLKEAGYEHYEISNFAKPSFRSQHNNSYWKSIPYIGIGAAAHSYNRISRQWNVADIRKYIHDIQKGECFWESEQLDLRTQYNDLITTALRTSEGISLENVDSLFGENYKQYLLDCAEKNIARQLLTLKDGRLQLTPKGIFVSNDVMSDLIALSTPSSSTTAKR